MPLHLTKAPWTRQGLVGYASAPSEVNGGR